MLYTDIQNIEISQAINEIVQYHKSNGMLGDNTLAISIKLSADCFDTDKNYIKMFTFLYNGNGYTTVAYTEKCSLDVEYDKELKEVEFIACHDSCWRDGTDRKMREISDEIDKYFKEEVEKNINISVFNSFHLGGISLLKGIKLNGSYDTDICKIIRD